MKLFKFYKDKKPVFKCACCGKEYNELPLCFGSEVPNAYYSVVDSERKGRIELKKSLCVIDGEHFFHRGRLTIPIIDHEEDFYFDIWTSISKENFELRMDSWENPERVNNQPYFGWIQTQVPTYENTLNIKSRVIEQEIGFIPEIEIGEENHQLTIDQSNGITLKRALAISQHILTQDHASN